MPPVLKNMHDLDVIHGVILKSSDNWIAAKVPCQVTRCLSESCSFLSAAAFFPLSQSNAVQIHSCLLRASWNYKIMHANVYNWISNWLFFFKSFSECVALIVNSGDTQFFVKIQLVALNGLCICVIWCLFLCRTNGCL